MSIESIPLIYFKPTIFLVDDNRSFLESLSLDLSYTGKIETYTSPKKALTELLSRGSLYSSDRYTDVINNDFIDDDRDYFAIDYQAIMHTVLRHEKYKEVGIVIVDYSMPEMNGIEFCEKIKHLSCLKVMLTAEADNSIAVRSFNKGIIQHFISKDPACLTESINLVVGELINKYFCEISKPLIGKDSEVNFNKNYIFIVKKWIQKNNIVEHYSCSATGSKLGIDTNGQAKWLIISTESCIRDYIDVATENRADQNIIDALQSGKFQLFLISERQKKEPIGNWNQYLVRVIDSFENSGENYFVSYYDGKNNFDQFFQN